MKLYTLGYQSLSERLYLQTLVNAGVGIVIDVRENAWSQRPDFIKSNLRSALATRNIDYNHSKRLVVHRAIERTLVVPTTV
jgi:uncharacterized protein (DUF488 family)